MQFNCAHRRTYLVLGTVVLLAACTTPIDFDIRGIANGFDTSEAARRGVAPRPTPDERGLISYPNYQVAVARPGDTVGDVAARVGVSPREMAELNGLPDGVELRSGELLVLPNRVAELDSTNDIAAIAGSAIDRSGPSNVTTTVIDTGGIEPIRHQVSAGETAFSIARLYDVSVRSLSEWNALGPELDVREGQFLLIPVVVEAEPEVAVGDPGVAAVAPVPPSSVQPLPNPELSPAEVAAATPASPELTSERTAASGESRLATPVPGNIIRAYEKGTNDGISIAAPAGTNVAAAESGSVAAITRDTDGVPIIVLRHEDNLLTVYAGVDDLTVEKGDAVSRGQKIAEVRDGSPTFLHFEVRQGFESVDPAPFLQ